MNELCVRIKDLRSKTELSQSKFSALTEIPLQTIQGWEQGLRVPPKYVVDMLEDSLKLKGVL